MSALERYEAARLERERQRAEDGLTVQGLIDLLLAVEDKALPVWADGCDCSNPVASVGTGDEGVTIGVFS